tara:strand:+ start:258 stop:806 length:549 start_codon:yes stop_codon:yes gene_type:complete
MAYKTTSDRQALKSLFSTGQPLIQSSFYDMINDIYTITVPLKFSATTSAPVLGQTTMTSFSASQSPLPYTLLKGASKVEIVGFTAMTATSSAAQASQLIFSVYGYNNAFGSQRGYGQGTLLYSNNSLSTSVAAATQYYRDTEDLFPEATILLNENDILFIDLNPTNWNLNDVISDLYVRYTF